MYSHALSKAISPPSLINESNYPVTTGKGEGDIKVCISVYLTHFDDYMYF